MYFCKTVNSRVNLRTKGSLVTSLDHCPPLTRGEHAYNNYMIVIHSNIITHNHVPSFTENILILSYLILFVIPKSWVSSFHLFFWVPRAESLIRERR